MEIASVKKHHIYNHCWKQLLYCIPGTCTILFCRWLRRRLLACCAFCSLWYVSHTSTLQLVISVRCFTVTSLSLCLQLLG